MSIVQFYWGGSLEAGELFAGEKLFWRDGENPYPLLARELARRGYPTARVAVDKSTQARFLLPLMASLPGAEFTGAGRIIDALRVYKDAEECERLRAACRLGDEALERVMRRGRDWLGRTESEFFAALAYEMSSLGLAEPGACVCAGKNAADPHHTAGGDRIGPGCLLVDFGGTFRGYWTDMTRTFWFGEPDAEFRAVYDIVREANAAAVAAAKPGARLCDVDAAARGVIERAGYGEYFIHRTGHGVGLDVHESPNADPREQSEIRPGMAFSIEPGIYLPGKFGVRIEDLVLITPAGPELLHHYPKELREY